MELGGAQGNEAQGKADLQSAVLGFRTGVRVEIEIREVQDSQGVNQPVVINLHTLATGSKSRNTY
jgi:hypothetical protein